MNKQRIIGVMSGSSLDGMDVAEIEISSNPSFYWSLKYYKAYDFPESLKEALKLSNRLNIKDYKLLEKSFTDFLAEVLTDFRTVFNSSANICGVHGHTVWHLPESGFSIQMLNGGRLAALSNMKVVTDFRNQDIAHNGVGTPLAVVADRDLFKGHSLYLNLGGIANISFQKGDQWIAYDLAPFNQVHNYFAQKAGLDYDENGQLASKGIVNDELLAQLQKNAFITSPCPKAIDNTWLKEVWITELEQSNLNIEDILATQNALLISEIEKLLDHEMKSIFITGGGARNLNFIQMLEMALKGKLKVVLPVESVIDYKEAVLMAYMAYLRINNEINTLASATGADQSSISGAIYHN